MVLCARNAEAPTQRCALRMRLTSHWMAQDITMWTLAVWSAGDTLESVMNSAIPSLRKPLDKSTIEHIQPKIDKLF